jgi:hypothetical protein
MVGATKAEYFTEIRKIVPDSFARSGVGAQGGSLSEVCKYGMNGTIGLSTLQEALFTHQMELILQKKRKRSSKKCNKKWKKLLVLSLKFRFKLEE